MAHIAVCGAGGWGTALAVMASRFGQDVALWSPFEEEIEGIRRHGEHKKLLPGIPVPRDVRLTSDLACAADADLVLLSVPSFAVGQTAEKLRPHLRPDTVVANAGKGLEEATLRRFSDILTDKLPGIRVAVLSGPSHAEEVGRGRAHLGGQRVHRPGGGGAGTGLADESHFPDLFEPGCRRCGIGRRSSKTLLLSPRASATAWIWGTIPKRP